MARKKNYLAVLCLGVLLFGGCREKKRHKAIERYYQENPASPSFLGKSFKSPSWQAKPPQAGAYRTVSSPEKGPYQNESLTPDYYGIEQQDREVFLQETGLGTTFRRPAKQSPTRRLPAYLQGDYGATKRYN